MKAKILLLSIILFILLTGCVKDRPQNPESNTDPIVNIGHGVYYFNLIGTEFCIELAKFKTNHDIITIASDAMRHGTVGYIVVCKEE